jgi:hypothetical protein
MRFNWAFEGLIENIVFNSNRGILDVHGSVHYSINRIEINNKLRPCSRIYYSNIS